MALRTNAKIDAIRSVPLFAACSRRELGAIASLAEEVDLPDGKVIIREGETGREFFALVEGTAEVRRKGRKVADIGPGDFVGELALLTRRPRTATVTTTSDVRTLVLTDRAFRSLLESTPLIQLKILQALAERVAPQIA